MSDAWRLAELLAEMRQVWTSTPVPTGHEIQYLGFAVNGEACERFLGDAFETHLPSTDQIVFNTPFGEVVCGVGTWIVQGYTRRADR